MHTNNSPPPHPLRRLIHWLLSVPIFIKILGIITATAWLFGVSVLVQTHTNMSRILTQLLEQKAGSATWTVLRDLEGVLDAEPALLQARLEQIRQLHPELKSIILWDPSGQVLAGAWGRPPTAEILTWRKQPVQAPQVDVRDTTEGYLLNAAVPLPRGRAGALQISLLDEVVGEELSLLTRTIIWTFLVCVAVGTFMALVYTHYIVTRPIYRLVEATERLGKGDFKTRAEVISDDEIGRLARAFNRMADRLQQSSREIREKEKARLELLDKLVETQEEERKTISRELHDQIGQSLLALLLEVQSDSLHRQLDPARQQELEDQLRQLINEVRHLSWSMRPSILDDYGLEKALERYAESTSAHYDIPIDFQYVHAEAGEPRLPNRIEVTLYRVAQEAVTNILAHAHATRASIVLIHQPDQVILLIEDNGEGFNVSQTLEEESRSLGLRGMQERVALHGGSCVYEATPGHGTTVRVTIPLELKVS